MYLEATKKPLDFFKISVEEQAKNKKFSKNFKDFFILDAKPDEPKKKEIGKNDSESESESENED